MILNLMFCRLTSQVGNLDMVDLGFAILGNTILRSEASPDNVPTGLILLMATSTPTSRYTIYYKCNRNNYNQLHDFIVSKFKHRMT